MEKKDIHSEVWLAPWDPEWQHEFHLEKQCIIGALIDDGGSVAVRHVGSTSIEGMPAKPIIDILVCPDKSVPLESCIPKLERIGYRNLGECGRPGRYFLSSGREPGKTFYVHLCYQELDTEAKKAYQYYEYTPPYGSRSILREFYQAVSARVQAFNRNLAWEDEDSAISLRDVRVLILES